MKPAFTISGVLAIALALSTAAPSASAWEGGNNGPRGGFFENAKNLLKAAVTELADEIKYARPVAFAKMPDAWTTQKWTPEALERLIRGTRSQYMVEKPRPNAQGDLEPLVFDYGYENDVPYLAAMKPFFYSYQASDGKRGEVKIALLHEFFHLLGLDDAPAEDWAYYLQGELRRHQIPQYQRDPAPLQAAWDALPPTRSPSQLKELIPGKVELCGGGYCFKMKAKGNRIGGEFGDYCPTEQGYLGCSEAKNGTDAYFARYFRVADDGSILVQERGTGTSVNGAVELKGEYRYYYIR
jgi:hypothetical protein